MRVGSRGETRLTASTAIRPASEPNVLRPGRRLPTRQWLACTLGITISLVIVSVALGSHQRNDPTFGPIDEQAHYDYVLDLAQGRVPAWGDSYRQETLRMISCLGVLHAGMRGCATATRNPLMYAPRGYSYETQQAPLAYLPYVVTARPNSSPARALVSARDGGIVWLCITACLLVVVGWIESLSLLELTTVLSICLLSPVAVYSWSTVTNDSAAVAAGAIAVITVAIARRRGSGLASVGLGVGAILGLLKGLFFIAPLALLLGGLLAELPGRGRVTPSELWRRHGCSALMLFGTALSFAGWIVLQDARATVPPMQVLDALLPRTAHFPWDTMFQTFYDQLTMLVPVAATDPSYWLQNPSAPLYSIWNVCVFGSLLAVVLRARPGSDSVALRTAAIGAVTALALVCFAYMIILYVVGHYDSGVSARLGLPVLPIIAVLVVRYLRRSGLVALGIALPAVAAVAQLTSG